MSRIGIGIIGLGTVGTGVVKVLRQNREVIRKRLGAELVIRCIADLDVDRDRGVAVDPAILGRDPDRIFKDPEVSIVAELIGGEEPACTYILKAIESGKHVVTANKALLAARGNEIFAAAHKHRVDVAFEGSVCGGIPIIRAVKEGLAANRIQRIQGIVNGTSNYILTEMTERGEDFDVVLRRAQEKGYAEADPTLDIEGIDAAHKLSILMALTYGGRIRFKDIYVEGISHLKPLDITFARELGYKIKLLALSANDGERLEARVHPAMVPLGSPLSTVDGVFNALRIEGDAVGTTLFYGMGAGMMPTASAVVGDIIEIGRNVLKGVSQRVPALSCGWDLLKEPVIKPMSEVVTNYYMRLTAADRPGVLSGISGVLAKYGISILSVVQKGRRGSEDGVPVVMMTHGASESGVQKALKEIDELPVTLGRTQLIRVEDETIRGEGL
jgi:homoserine dehydrogenase